MFENIRLSLQGILSHKIRSFLTMLGIIIGIAAIIAIVSTIEGTNMQIKNNLIGAGSNTVNIQLMQGDYPVSQYGGDGNMTGDSVRMITDQYKQRILDLKEVDACTLYRSRENVSGVYYLDKMMESSVIYGIDADYLGILGYEIAEGIPFTESQYTDFSKVVLVDSTVERGFFQGENPVGKIIEIRGEPFTVIGVVAKRSGFEPTINSVEDYYMYNRTSSGQIFMPINSWCIPFRYDEPQDCVIKAVNTDSMTAAGKKAADILNENVRKTSQAENPAGEEESMEMGMFGGGRDFEYKSESLLEQAKQLQDLSKSTNSMLIWIASISLLVGGIGVMNIMLVSVTERTREIGLKKALGARKRRILAQFLTEASVLTSIGGLIGVICGIGLSKIVASLAQVPVSISTKAIAVSVIFSMAVGIVFGLIPSIKAANLSPIDALRYE